MPVLVAVMVLRRRWRQHRRGPWVTNATWTRRGDKVLHPLGRAHPWHHLPLLTRAGIETGAWAHGSGHGVRADRRARRHRRHAVRCRRCRRSATACWRAYLRIRRWQHYRTWERPLHRALTPVLGAPPARLAIERDRSGRDHPPARDVHRRGPDPRVRSCTPSPPNWPWRRPTPTGRNCTARQPVVTFTRSQPPPSRVSWADVEHAIAAAGPARPHVRDRQEVRRRVRVDQDSTRPHFGEAMGTGAGKSNAAAFWLVQELMRGVVRAHSRRQVVQPPVDLQGHGRRVRAAPERRLRPARPSSCTTRWCGSAWSCSAVRR